MSSRSKELSLCLTAPQALHSPMSCVPVRAVWLGRHGCGDGSPPTTVASFFSTCGVQVLALGAGSIQNHFDVPGTFIASSHLFWLSSIRCESGTNKAHNYTARSAQYFLVCSPPQTLSPLLDSLALISPLHRPSFPVIKHSPSSVTSE